MKRNLFVLAGIGVIAAGIRWWDVRQSHRREATLWQEAGLKHPRYQA